MVYCLIFLGQGDILVGLDEVIMRKFWPLLLLFCLFTSAAKAQDFCCFEEEPAECQLMKDLLIVDYWNKRNAHRVPVTYNHLLLGGYFSMPSARMGEEGELGIGYAYVPPYIHWNGRCQLIDRLELSGNYRIFRGVDDPNLSKHGFGDFSDKGANAKFAIILPEDSGYALPGVAIGFEDFLGTRNFNAYYAVATQVFKDYDFEFSLGYGFKRYHRWFGGMQWFPFRQMWCLHGLETFSLAAEYDATNYRSHKCEPHPKGRDTRSPINFGCKYRLWDSIDFSVAYMRGKKVAASVSAFYNFGMSEGLLPKVDAPLPYKAPVNTECLGDFRPPEWLTNELAFALKEQGFLLLQADLFIDDFCDQAIRIRVVNEVWRMEAEVRQRLSAILAALLPSNFCYVIAVIDGEGFPVQEYRIPVALLRRFGEDCLCEQEFITLAPLREVSCLPCHSYTTIYKGHLSPFCTTLLPKTNMLFGSAKGKFKYAAGLNLFFDGFIYNDIYYNVALGYIFAQDMHSSGIDSLNPSQVINVRTDIVRYLSRPGISVDNAYLQKNWNLGCGWFARASIGLFEIEYGGIAAEFLYYPVGSNWAVGVEGACLRKRTLSGVGFSDKVRYLKGFDVHYRGFLGSQGFLNLYYDIQPCNLELRLKLGKFLANDVGIRYEVSRYFPSGMRVTFWYTQTNKRDNINGSRYYDKGVAISMPLDIFYTCSSRNKWRYGLSAWLRDVGIIGGNGESLYEIIDDLRQ